MASSNETRLTPATGRRSGGAVGENAKHGRHKTAGSKFNLPGLKRKGGGGVGVRDKYEDSGLLI